MGFTGRWLSCYCHYSKRNLYSSNSRALGALMNTLRTQASPVRLKVQQRRAGGFAAGVAADHAAALFPAALAFDLVGGRAILGHAPGHAHPPAVAAEELPIGKTRGFGNGLHPAGDLGFRQPEHLLMAANTVGAIVSAIHRTAQRAQPAVAAILDRIRASPVVHADETGWRQSGANGYVWTFSTPTERYFLRTLLPAAGSGQGGGGRSAERCFLRSIGQRLLRRLPPL